MAVRVRRAKETQDVVDALVARQAEAREMGEGVAGEPGRTWSLTLYIFPTFLASTITLFISFPSCFVMNGNVSFV